MANDIHRDGIAGLCVVGVVAGFLSDHQIVIDGCSEEERRLIREGREPTVRRMLWRRAIRPAQVARAAALSSGLGDCAAEVFDRGPQSWWLLHQLVAEISR